MKKLIAMLLVLAMALSLAACSGKTQPTTENTEKPTNGDTKPEEDTKGEPQEEVKKYKFGIIYTASNYFWDKVGDGGKAKAEELNETGKYQIDIYATGPQTTGAAGQIQLMEDMISQGYDGIIISSSDSSALQPTIDKAVDAGIPVVCMDTEVPDSKRLCFVGTDNYNFGCDVARELARVCGGKGGVLVQYIAPEMLAMAERMRGFQETIENEYPDMEILYVQADSGADYTAIAAALETMVAKYSDFVGYAVCWR